MNLGIIMISIFIVVLGMVVNNAFKYKDKNSIIRNEELIFVVIAIFGGIIYAIGYFYEFDGSIWSFFMCIERTLLATILMFVGVDKLGEISNNSIINTGAILFIFWSCHLIAATLTIKVALQTFGSKFLINLRFIFSNNIDIYIIYGLNERTVKLVHGLNDKDKNRKYIIIVDDKSEKQFEDLINNQKSNILYRNDKNALEVDNSFIKSLHLNQNHKIVLYTLNDDYKSNFDYAVLFDEKIKSYESKNYSLKIFGDEYEIYDDLNKDTKYEDIYVFNECDLVTRQLVNDYPPCNYIDFENYKAKKDSIFKCMIIGLDDFGQEAFKKLLLNGQFYNNEFNIFLVDENVDEKLGVFKANYKGLFDEECILNWKYETIDTQYLSSEVCYKIKNGKIKYIVVSTNNNENNMYIAKKLYSFKHYNSIEFDIFVCNNDALIKYNGINDIKKYDIYSAEMLLKNDIDDFVKKYHYKGKYKEKYHNKEECWKNIDAYGRLSNRAAADFSKSFLKILNIDKKDITTKIDSLSMEEKETLAKTEHLRWCAYEYLLGFTKMSRDVHKEFGDRIDKERKLQACLVDWDELDEVSKVQNSFGKGENRDFKLADINNVDVLKEIFG